MNTEREPMMSTTIHLVRNRPWSRLSSSYGKRDQLPTLSPIVGDPIGYACGSGGFDPIHHTTAHRRLLEGKPVFWSTFSECRTHEDRADARALLRFRLDA